MEPKLFDSERKVMEVLWEADAPLTAKEIAARLGAAVKELPNAELSADAAMEPGQFAEQSIDTAKNL